MSRTDHHLPVRYREGMPPRLVLLPYWRGKRRSTLAVYANRLERRARAEFRTYSVLVASTYRAGGDLEHLAEPDARPRHGACWDLW
ncbi:hypothetical protein Caci_7790 [Catenulispora acidiphila DSM 44928]|uniref:Uncharacterized protein n=1 Tax=Catenulispora acidiphila (strain DSM 44928 / JCM 14897 / NBRC 102108 / NRRL B-24433 / ID139908) TaxID=479433 RepID=C7QE26_CATAD|nr:hypothetical protein [Catenulispora acidiphila]ACU76614.1 hypothetical protein Caci_7790 [Catenulispora acidiphila DSM 44928]